MAVAPAGSVPEASVSETELIHLTSGERRPATSQKRVNSPQVTHKVTEPHNYRTLTFQSLEGS